MVLVMSGTSVEPALYVTQCLWPVVCWRSNDSPQPLCNNYIHYVTREVISVCVSGLLIKRSVSLPLSLYILCSSPISLLHPIYLPTVTLPS